MNDRSLIRMEKRATNHVGLFFVLLLTAIGLGVGGYLLYKNKDNLDLILPWEKQEHDEEEHEPIIDDKEDNTSNGKLFLPEINPDTNIISGNEFKLGLYIKKIKATEKGYVIDFEYKNDANVEPNVEYIKDGTIKLKCTKILIDEFEVSPTFELEFNNKNKTSDKTTITIPIEELENLEVVTFNSLYFFVTMEREDVENIEEEDEIFDVEGMILAYQDLNISNVKKIEKSYTVQNKVRISYYKKIEAEDATYLYFQTENSHQEYTQEIQLKKLLVNDEIYNKTSLKIKNHYDSKNIFFIKIPRKEYRKVDKFTASFYVIKDNDGNKSIFSTNELTFDLTK